VQLPPSLAALDISDIFWIPMVLTIPPNLLVLRANRAQVIGIQPFDPSGSSLKEVTLDGSSFAAQPIVAQMAQFANLLSTQSLFSLSCRNCGLQFSFAQMLQSVKQVSQNLEVLRFGQVSRFTRDKRRKAEPSRLIRICAWVFLLLCWLLVLFLFPSERFAR
jgi:hypothetical protein